MNNKYNGIKKDFQRRKKRIERYSSRHKKSAIKESLVFGLKLTGLLLPLGLGTVLTTAGVKGINENAYEKTVTSDFKTKTEIFDKEEIKDKKSAIYEYSPFIQMPDGTYMRTIKTYDPSDLSADDIADTLEKNPNADIKQFFGEPIETTSEIRENLFDVDNINKHYTAKVYKNMSDDKFRIISLVSIADLLLLLMTYVIYDTIDPLDTLDDIICDISSIRDDSKDVKKERKVYKEQKKEIKALTKTLKL